MTNVTLRQRYPWNGKVDIDYEIASEGIVSNVLLAVTAGNRVTGAALPVKTLSEAGSTNALVTSTGHHRLTWDAGTDAPGIVSSNVAISVSTVVYGLPLYLVVDLSGGTGAASYPLAALDAVPAGGWTDEYKTTKLVLRRIEPGTYFEADIRTVTLTNRFYIGVFELTQRQWELVMGNRPSYFTTDYATRPVEQVSYNDIRGSSAGAGWPGSSAVDATSFMGELRAKTGQAFDLPTEAQWEYACRAGTTTYYNNGSNDDSTLATLGRYWDNGGSSCSQSVGTSGGTAVVGSYRPNAWGLYDMHGNVWEWDLDWSDGLSSSAATEPVGAASGSCRVLRGGGWRDCARNCRSAYRCYDAPFYWRCSLGFRPALAVGP